MRMRKKYKKPVSFLLLLMLVIGVLSLSTVTAFAANAGTEAALVAAVNKGGEVKLTKDIALTDVLHIPQGVTVTLDLNGKTLDRGLTQCVDQGSVIRVEPGGTLTIRDGSDNNAGLITGGASWNGGGICNHGTLTIEGGTIAGNKAEHASYGGGGGVYSDSYRGSNATLTITGGVIRDNNARNGGGVYSKGALTVKDGVTVRKVGSKSYEIKTNPVITGNTAASHGAGIYSAGSMFIEGEITLAGNAGNDDVYLAADKKIECGRLAHQKPFGIACEENDQTVVSGFEADSSEKTGKYFFPSVAGSRFLAETDDTISLCSDSNTYVEIYVNGMLLHSNSQPDPDKMWTYAKEMTKTYLNTKDDCVVSFSLGKDWEEDQQLTVDTSFNFIIDLNGHYIKRTRNGSKTKNGNIISIGENAKLTIRDSNPNADGYDGLKGGVLTGGAGSDCGGGIVMWKNAELYMEGGTIYDCSTNYHGGGILANSSNAVVSLKNCVIDSCKTNSSSDNCNGGGIYISQARSVTMDNVTVRNCYSEDYGGGLFIKDKPGVMRLNNCSFLNNSCLDGGGAIHFAGLNADTEFSFIATNCTFTGNKANGYGGAVDIGDDDEKKGNPTVFRDCTFTENESEWAGSALHINDNRVVLQGGTITNNYTKTQGAVFVEGNYTLCVGGRLVIRDNRANKADKQNLVLKKGSDRAFLSDAGLDEGSYISISNSSGAKDARILTDVGKYQTKYFHAESGTLSFTKLGVKTATAATATILGNGSVRILLIVLGAAAVAAAATVITIKKKKGGSADNDDDDEEE